MPPSSYRWNVTLRHNEHLHDFGEYTDTANLAFTPTRDHDADSHYEVTLTVTDSHGAEAERTVELQPQIAPLRLDTEPSGVSLSYAGAKVVTPYEAMAGVGFHTTVTAPAELEHDGRPYEFLSWSDGGERLHEIDVPAEGIDLKAAFRDLTPLPAATLELVPGGPATPGPGSPAFVDRVPPQLRFNSRRGLDARRGLLTGSASDSSGIRSVEIAVGRALASRRCRWWAVSRGRLSNAPRSCRRPRWIKARLFPARSGSRWQVSLRRRPLPAGGYRLLFRARDVAGNEGRTLTTGGRLLRLSVRRPR